jgi:hypothetical protein
MDAERLTKRYLKIKQFVIDVGFFEEINFYDKDRDLSALSEGDFAREVAWVILNSGMKNTVIAKKFPEITEAFCGWDLEIVMGTKELCRRYALAVFNSEPKIDSILKCCEIIHKQGMENIRAEIREGGIEYLQTFPYIGPVISYHLAKNIGYDCVKPDRHLCRMSDVLGYKTPLEMCEEIRTITGDKLAVIDIVLWRYATLDEHYIDFLIS